MIDIFYHIFDIYEISALSFDLLRASLALFVNLFGETINKAKIFPFSTGAQAPVFADAFKRQLPQGAAERGFSPQHPNEKSHDSNIGILALYLWEDLII